MTDYTKWPVNQLKDLRKDTETTILRLEMEAIKDSDNAAAYTTLLGTYKTELNAVKKALEGKVDDVQFPDNNDSYDYQCRIQMLQMEMKSVKRLEPGHNVETFLSGLQNIFAIHVAPYQQKFPQIENDFCRMCQGRLHQTYLTTLLATKKEYDTFEKLNNYLANTYASQMSNFQVLSKLWTLDFRAGESYRDYAARLDIETTNACRSIMAKWAKDNATEANPSPVLNAQGAFALIGAMLMSERVRLRSPIIYGHLLKKMDKHTSAAQVANVAQVMSDRQIDETETTVHHAFYNKDGKGDQVKVVPTVHHKKPKSRYHKEKRTYTNSEKEMMKKRICLDFNSKKGCSRGKCGFQHVKYNPGTVSNNHYCSNNDAEHNTNYIAYNNGHAANYSALDFQ